MLNSTAVVARLAWRYIHVMAGNRMNGSSDFMMGFVEGPTRRTLVARQSPPEPETHEQRLVGAVGRATRREGVQSLKGLSDQEILDSILS
jgi:hypothetical protein